MSSLVTRSCVNHTCLCSYLSEIEESIHCTFDSRSCNSQAVLSSSEVRHETTFTRPVLSKRIIDLHKWLILEQMEIS